MSLLLGLPAELLQLIVESSDSQRDINAFIRTCRYLYNAFDGYLYRYNMQQCNRSALFWAARRGENITVARSLRAGPYTEVRDIYDETPLIAAVSGRQQSIVKQLLMTIHHGLDLEATGQHGRTALAHAAWDGQIQMASLLLAKGASLASKDTDDASPLILAAVNGHHEVMTLLLDHGAALEAQDRLGQTALAWAAEYGKVQTVELLLERGAVVDSRDRQQSTPLLLAARNGHDVVVKRLLEKGADANARDLNGWTAIHHAAWHSPKKVVIEHLLEAGADPKATIRHGKTGADLADAAILCVAEKSVVHRMLLQAAGESNSIGVAC
ncbi:ankyrin repeat-containing domain protein [Aspergillus californicus]